MVARESIWNWFAFAEGSLTGGGIDNDTPIEGRLYPLNGSNVYLYDGLSISTKDGPAFTGDQYTIEQDSDYPFNRISPSFSYSPRVQYRSASVGSGTIKADNPTIDEIYLYHDEAKDWIVKLGASTFRRIVSNTEGLLTNTVGKKAILKLDGVNNASDPVSGTAYLIPSSATITANLLGVEGSAWALKIPSQSTIDNYFTLGSFLFGVVEVQAPQYGNQDKKKIEWTEDSIHKLELWSLHA